MTTLDKAVTAFAEDVGATDAVVPVGSRTQWAIGGEPIPGAREVRPPSGVVRYEPAEMVVRCWSGTTFAEVDAVLAAAGQMVPLDPREGHATVGGLLAVGHSGLRRLRYGPVRDTLLQARFVNAAGRVVTAGGAVVKNVSGFDLCRLLVGSLGTIGLLAEVVLRAQPRPAVSLWLKGEGQDPRLVRARLFRPSSILWDGAAVWVLLEGRPADVEAERAALGATFSEVEAPPPLPHGGRRSLRPREVFDVTGRFVAEVGVGTVHVDEPGPTAAVPASTARLHHAIKAAFDPSGRLNPGRVVA